MNWDLLYNQGIDVEDISGDSEEYEIMFFAAADGNPTAQYCLGLWAEKVDKEPEIALIWLKKAARQNFKEAIEELHRLESEQGVKTESFFRRKRLEKAFEAESQQSDSEQSATP